MQETILPLNIHLSPTVIKIIFIFLEDDKKHGDDINPRKYFRGEDHSLVVSETGTNLRVSMFHATGAIIPHHDKDR